MSRYLASAALALVMLLTAASVEVKASTGTPGIEALYGVWLFEHPSPDHQYDVKIVQDGQTWSVSVDGETVPASEEQEELTFTLASGQHFIGRVLDNNQIEGTWFQPPPNYGYYSHMATAVSFSPLSETTWQGQIDLQPRPFHLFLDIFKDAEGHAKAALRNPERNDILGATLFDLMAQKNAKPGPNWRLQARRGGREISIPFRYSQQGTITLEHPTAPKPTVFQKADKTDLAKYYSRTPSQGPVKHAEVTPLNDGWEVANAVDAGFDGSILDQLVTKLAAANPREQAPQLLHSLLVSHKGKLVLEEYFYGFSATDVHDTRSMAKVFGSILIGAAQQQGVLIDPSYAPLPDILRRNSLPVSKHASAITLEHFLTYTSGLDTAENDRSPGSEDRLWSQAREDFWLYTAKLPRLHGPGKRYAYSSASANMVGAAIEHFTQQPVREFFHQAIAKPLNFSAYHWNLTPQGTSYLGGGVYIRPRDILKLGALYAAKGKWQGQQIIPEAWIASSTTAKIEINPQTTGLSEEAFSNQYFGGGQAYIWRVDAVTADNKSFSSYSATGNGGQILMVVPELELAVVFTGGNYRMGYIWGKWPQRIVGDYLIPALLR